MLSDVPNLGWFFGYTNASWTLKADLSAQYLCRLLQHMAAHGLQRCVPRVKASKAETKPMLELTSGYVQRGLQRLPQQGTKWPFKLFQNYLQDRLHMQLSKIDDGNLELTRASAEN